MKPVAPVAAAATGKAATTVLAPGKKSAAAAPAKKKGGKTAVSKPAPAKPEAEAAKVEEEKKEEEKVPEEVPPVVEEPVPEVKEPVVGESIIRYNHYKKPFKHVDGCIKWEDIDEQYAFSFAFKGEYNLKLRKEKEPDLYLRCENKCFYDLEVGQIYLIEVEEDDVAESKIQKTTYKAVKTETKKKTTGADLLTQDLKNMTTEELTAQGSKYKEALEARELEEMFAGN